MLEAVEWVSFSEAWFGAARLVLDLELVWKWELPESIAEVSSFCRDLLLAVDFVAVLVEADTLLFVASPTPRLPRLRELPGRRSSRVRCAFAPSLTPVDDPVDGTSKSSALMAFDVSRETFWLRSGMRDPKPLPRPPVCFVAATLDRLRFL